MTRMKPHSLFIMIVVGLLLFGVGVLALYAAKVNRGIGNGPEEFTGGQICTQDAKQCPDGSYVSRTGPNCSFAECPGAGAAVEGSIEIQ